MGYVALPSKENLGNKFVALLRDQIGSTNLAEVKRRNRTEAYQGCCASHDFCDANMVMLAAFAFCMRCAEDDVQYMDDKVQARWNEAWDYARATKLS